MKIERKEKLVEVFWDYNKKVLIVVALVLYLLYKVMGG